MADTVAETRVRTTGIDHVVLHVGDLARSKKFYIGILGMSEHHGGDTHMFLKCGAQAIGLFEVGYARSSVPDPSSTTWRSTNRRAVMKRSRRCWRVTA